MKTRIAFWLCLGLLLSDSRRAAGAEAIAPMSTSELVLLTVEGTVEVALGGPEQWKPARPGLRLRPGDRLRTGRDSRATYRTVDLARGRVGDLSLMQVEPPRPDSDRPVLQLLRGFFYFFNRDKALEIELHNRLATAGTRSTEFHITVDERDQMQVAVFEGAVDLRNAQGSIVVAPGQQGVARPGEAPHLTAAVDAISLIQWCLYYPAVLDLDELPLTEEQQRDLSASLAAFRAGDLPGALRTYPDQRQPASPGEITYRAALALVVGQVAQTERLLQTLPKTTPLAEALWQIAATVRQRPWKRVGPPTLATEWLAESYALQAQSKLDAALRAARSATDKSPACGLAWARVAELEFSFGRTQRALAALDRALALAPRHAQALALKGFLLAAQHHVTDAVGWFDQAIAQDGALPEGWLGRGLCRVRQGRFADGQADLQTAAALQPQRAALRSYLGKSFAEDGQVARAETEFSEARRLDAQDPTSWLYSAVFKQQHNRVNEAIADLETSKELNDNRSVYRSRLMLDQDLAMRSANLARVYQDAGMEDLAFREASRAVNADYANYSAHLFLANSYEGLRDPTYFNLRYETAANSEYLLANLLSPVGASTLSPAISQLEYTRLLERNPWARVVSLTDYASNGDWRQAGAVYGTLGNTGYSLDAHYQSDNGQRPNSDLELVQIGVTLKQQITPQDTAFVQVGYADLERGDTAQRYNPALASPTFRARDRQEPSLSVGYRHQWQPGNETLFLFGRIDDQLDFGVREQSWGVPLLLLGTEGIDAVHGLGMEASYTGDFLVYSTELQQLWQHNDPHKSIFGVRYQWGQVDAQSAQWNPSDFQPWFPDPGTPPESQDITGGLRRFTVYGYHFWELLPALWLQAGLSYDWLEYPENTLYAPLSGDERPEDLISPKAGLTWSPWRDTTLRAAYTRSLSGATFEQSYRLEPVQLAGFTQAYRGLVPESVTGPVPGATLDTLGLALEHRFKSRTYVGLTAELLKSEADRTVGDFYIQPDGWLFPDGLDQTLDYEERALAVTLNQLVGKEWAFGARYRLTRSALATDYRGVPDSAEQVNFARTQDLTSILHQVSLDAVYNHRCGFFARFNALWNQQSNQGFSPDEPGDDFWQWNVFTGYRLPGRRAEITIGVLNLTDQDYQLEPLSPYQELARDRTLVATLKLSY